MKTFRICAINSSREFEGNDLDTVISVLSHAATRSFFGFGAGDSQDEIREALSTLVPHVATVINKGNATDMRSLPESFRDAILNAVLDDGAQIEIEYYAAEDDKADEVTPGEGGFDPTANANPETWHVNGHDTGIPLTDAVRMASLTPLSVLGFDSRKGKIAEGYDEDLIVFDDDIRIKRVFVAGKALS